LEDSTRVWLNAASSIRYPVAFSGKDRQVSITGEAYFEVAHRRKMPFIVMAGNERVEDIGTRFNINAYSDEPVMETTLLVGAVSISVAKGQNSDQRTVFLKPAEQARVRRGESPAITVLKNVNVDDVIAWKAGKFRFSSVDIATIMRQAARWYDVDIVYKGKVKGTLSGGIQRSVNISELLQLLELTGRVTFGVENKKVIVQPVEIK
ncbi:MAG TPA: FecR domain-containing protein, partial [Chitinophagaceae bacterium]|nr:FecR domain-containing protein [Chitinophagaceae bacterium]